MQNREAVGEEDLIRAIQLVILPRSTLTEQPQQEEEPPPPPPPPPPPTDQDEQQEEQEEEEQDNEQEQEQEVRLVCARLNLQPGTLICAWGCSRTSCHRSL